MLKTFQKIEKEKKKQQDLEAATLILIKIAEEKKNREERSPTKRVLHSNRRSLNGEYLRSSHESMRWKLFEKLSDDNRLRSDQSVAATETSPQHETEPDLGSESDSSVSELSVDLSLSYTKEICSKIDTCRRGSRSEQKARDAHRSPVVSRDRPVGDFSECSTFRGNGRRRPSLVQDRNHKTDIMNTDGRSKEDSVRDYDIEYERRRRKESISEEYERKVMEEAKIKKRLSKEAKVKDDMDRRLSISHIQLFKINPGTARSSKS